jgi:hypothetical protein
MSFSILALAAAAAMHGPAAQAVDPEQARAAGMAQAQAQLAGSGAQNASIPQRRTDARATAGPLVGSSTAFDGLHFQPIADAGANVRFYKGVATIDREDDSAAVQVTPMGLDHGRLTFAVSVLNLSQAPDNFGIENVTATVGDQSLPVLSRDRLDHMASNRAHWKQFGMAMLGGIAAASEANTSDVYHATTYTPYGTYRTSIIMPSISGQIAAARTSDETSYAIAGIQARLDATREALADEVLQTTTVMPQDSYAARVVIEKFKGKWPQKVHLVMAFAGKQYPFDFEVAKQH